MNDFLRVLINEIGYFNFIHLKDTVVYLAGIFTGLLLCIFAVGNYFYKIKKINAPKELTSIKVKNKSGTSYFFNFSNYFEAVETLTILTILSFFHKKEYLTKNPKRTNIVLYGVIIITILLMILSAILIRTTILP